MPKTGLRWVILMEKESMGNQIFENREDGVLCHVGLKRPNISLSHFSPT